jgi:hypothetical protein
LICADAPLAAMAKKSPAIAKCFIQFSLYGQSDPISKIFSWHRL